MAVRAVFDTVPQARGMYESFYLRAVCPDRPLGVWIRCTVHKRSNAPPRGSVWCTVFDAEAPAPFMHKTTTERLSVPPGGWISVGDSHIGPGAAEGSCGPASWSLRFSQEEPELRHLSSELLYRAPIPRTKLTSPAPAAVFEGTLRLPGRELDLSGWRGMVGHNWGAEHAERWVWLHGIDFSGAPDAWIDVAVGRILVAGAMSPWVANGALAVDGARLPIGGLLARGVRVAERPDRCSLQLPGRGGLSIEAHVESPSGASAGWRYADPDGGEHHVLNCSIAALRLVVRRRGQAARTLTTEHGAAYELGLRQHDHGVAIAPFADG